ncbi:putative MFS family arabinose efflux permease [Micromonospora pisi]|uniref:Putative MFS family arabinose efflux permease n=1 Tax=Micromonospora pisi TaxID=589240 RepID=A0A495JPI0_9ACTN|nr:MFS transporter [Micromonospora pisi]RKR90907.1 putative MFS family arabinose efflux permease [Micromonospora pisi]
MTQQLTAAGPARRTPSRPSLWRSRNFLLLWGGQTVSELGTRISHVAVPVVAADALGASIFQVSLLTFLAWLPYLLFSLPAGALADRVDQRKLMILCDLGRMALMLSLPLVAIAGRLTLTFLYVVVGLSGVLTVGFTVAYRSRFPRLVEADQLVDGNAKLVLSQDAAELVGPTIGGVLIGLVGAARTFFGNAIAFLVSAVTLWLIRETPEQRATPASSRDRVSPRTAMTEGLAFVRRQPILLKILACTTTSNFFVMASGSIEVTFMLRELHASSVMVGLVFSVSAIGGLTLGIFANRLTNRIGTARVIWVAMAAPGPLYLLMPLAQPGWGVLLYGVGLAAFSGNAVLFNIAAMSYRQRITPPEILGRVNATFLWICYGVIPLGALVGGTLGSQLGLRTALWICVLGTWSAALFVVFSPLRKMRDLPAT